MDTATLQNIATRDAINNGVPPALFLWQIGQESSWNPNAQNGNATGIAQFMPSTARGFGIDPTDPVASLNAAAQYDAQLFAQTGNWQSAFTKYGTLANVGQSVMDSFQQVAQSVNGQGVGMSSLSGLGGSLTNAVTQYGQTTGGNSSITNIKPDSFIAKLAYIVLGVVIIGGAIYTYKK